MFVVVTRVRKANGSQVPGDTKFDSSGSISGDWGTVFQAGLGVVNNLTNDRAGNLFIISEFSKFGDDNPLFIACKVDAQTNIINTIAGNKTAKSGERL